MAHPKLVFYDIKTLIPGRSLSQNTWRVRLVLNYKKLPYETVWSEGFDITATCIAAGIPPLDKRDDGSPHYTLPALVDHTNSDAPVRLCDSRKIIDYLEATYPYPDSQDALLPPGTRGLQKLADAHFDTTILPLATPLIIPSMARKLPERLRPSLERKYAPPGKTFAETELRGKERDEAWKGLRAQFDKLGELAEGDIFFSGHKLRYFDIHVLAGLTAMRLAIGDEEFEKELGTSAGGRWVKLVKALPKYYWSKASNITTKTACRWT